MNLRALRLFVTTAETGALGRASERLHLSQPAASRQLKSLESELGIVLFERLGHRLRLTADGEHLLWHAREALAAIESIAERARALKRGDTGTLKLAATPHVITSLLASFLRGFCARYAGVEVQLFEGGAASQPARLDGGQVYLAIMPVGEERFEGRLLYPVHALAVMSDRHRLARRAVLEVAELAHEPLLVLRQEFGSHAWFYAATEIAHFKPHVRLESAAPETLVELATAQYGVAIVPSTVVLRARELKAMPLVQRGTSLGRWVMIAWNPRRMRPAYAERFVDELCTHIRAGYPGEAVVRRAPPLARPKHPKR